MMMSSRHPLPHVMSSRHLLPHVMSSRHPMPHVMSSRHPLPHVPSCFLAELAREDVRILPQHRTIHQQHRSNTAQYSTAQHSTTQHNTSHHITSSTGRTCVRCDVVVCACMLVLVCVCTIIVVIGSTMRWGGTDMRDVCVSCACAVACICPRARMHAACCY